MSFPGVPLVLLPPRPAPRDWALAGASAGLLLGLAELLVALPASPPPAVALLSVASLALGLALAAFALGCALRALPERPSYSALVAWVAGLIGLAAVAPLGLAASGPLALGALALAVLATAGVSYATARIADRSERAGTPAHALFWWGVTALLVAAAERACMAGPRSGVVRGVLLAGLVLGSAAAVCAIVAFARRRRANRPRAAFSRVFGVLAAASVAAALAPWALPWLLAERTVVSPGAAPANILILAWEPARAAAEARDTRALAGWSGIRYEPLVADPGRALESLLTLPDGAALVPVLAQGGYVTAAIVTDAALAPAVGAREVDARPGGRAQLERELRWLAAAPWLTGPARRALDRFGLGGEVRTPEQLASDARGWLLRRGASPIPFFLLVDFRRPAQDDARDDARAQEAAASLLDQLAQTGLAERTLVLLVLTGGPQGRPLQVVVRPPLAWPDAAFAATLRPIHANELGAALREIGQRDGATPVALPGVAGS